MRVCKCCGEAKPDTDFYRNSKRDRYETKCKVCFKAAVKTYADANREVVRASNKVAGDKFRDTHRERENRRVLAAFHANKERYSQRHAEWRKANPHLKNAKEAKRRASKAQATPVWADLNAIKAIYRTAVDLSRQTGVPMEVDHIVPLKSDEVCGLHCEANLRVITATENRSKHNRFDEALLNSF